jgi:long-subunit acyl-CoA synthetase (AMP-forming)
MFIAMFNHPDYKSTDFSHMRTGIMAGAGCPPELMKRAADPNEMNMTGIVSVYGQTESAPGTTMSSWDDPIDVRTETVGYHFAHVQCKIVDPETGETLGDDQNGEFLSKGYNTMKGYYKMPEETKKAIDPDGWLHTGDMGYICPFDTDFLYVVGRFKSLLISSDGEKYSPEGFEDSLTDGSKFVNACVLHNNQNPYCVALIVPDKGALKEAVEAKGLSADSEEGKKAMLEIIQAEVDSYKKGGRHEGMFPERWLPSAIGICDEEFTIANRMMNSTSKIVRGKVEEHYASLLDYLYTAEGKNLINPRNIAALG